MGSERFLLIKSVIIKLLWIIEVTFFVGILIFLIFLMIIWCLSDVVRLLWFFKWFLMRTDIILILLWSFIDSRIWILTEVLLIDRVFSESKRIMRSDKALRSHWLTYILVGLNMKVSSIIKRIKLPLVWINWSWLIAQIIIVILDLWNIIWIIMWILMSLTWYVPILLDTKMRLTINWFLINRLRWGRNESGNTWIKSHAVWVCRAIDTFNWLSAVNTVYTASSTLSIWFVQISNRIGMMRILWMSRRYDSFVRFLKRIEIGRSVCFVGFHFLKKLLNIFSFVFKQMHQSVSKTIIINS